MYANVTHVPLVRRERNIKNYIKTGVLALLMLVGIMIAFPSIAFTDFGGATLPGELAGSALAGTITELAEIGPGMKALVGFIAFVVALVSLAALRNFAPVLFFIGVAVFATTGLTVAGAIMGADIGMLESRVEYASALSLTAPDVAASLSAVAAAPL